MTSAAPIHDVIHTSAPQGNDVSHSHSNSRRLEEVSVAETKQSGSIPPQVPEADVATVTKLARHVPTTWPHAFRVFVSKMGVIMQLGFILGAAAVRTCSGPWRALDTCVVFSGILWWVFQEWFMHAKLLHGSIEWMGKVMHTQHHSQPYHHVCVTSATTVVQGTLAATVIFRLAIWSTRLLTSFLLGYYFMGLVYDWVHYIVHLKLPFTSHILRGLKSHHVKHHLRDSSHYFSVVFPPLDSLLGSLPPTETKGRKSVAVRPASLAGATAAAGSAPLKTKGAAAAASSPSAAAAASSPSAAAAAEGGIAVITPPSAATAVVVGVAGVA